MAKKIKKFTKSLAPRRGGEKMRRAARQFDRSVIGYITMVIIAVFIGILGDFSLGQPAPNGFAINFLLLPAYLPLLVLDGIFICCGGSVVPDAGYEVYLLGGCDLFLALTAWIIVRWWARKKQSINILRTARTFTLIMFVWGVFQIICCGIQFSQNKSEFDTAVITTSSPGVKTETK